MKQYILLYFVILNIHFQLIYSSLRQLLRDKAIFDNKISLFGINSTCTISKLLNFTDKTEEFLKYNQDENLIKKYHNIEKFFESITTETIYEGKWKSSKNFPALNSDKGDILISIQLRSVGYNITPYNVFENKDEVKLNYLNYLSLTIVLIDDKSNNNNWILIESDTDTFENFCFNNNVDVISDKIINIEKQQVLLKEINVLNLMAEKNITLNLNLSKEIKEDRLIIENNFSNLKNELIKNQIGLYDKEFNESISKNIKNEEDFIITKDELIEYHNKMKPLVENLFKLKDSSNKKETNQIKGLIHVPYDVDFDIEITFEVEESFDFNNKFENYTKFMNVMAFLQILSNLLIFRCLKKFSNLSKDFCLLTLILNSIWNTYCLITNFYIAIIYVNKTLDLSFSALILFLNFILEIRVIYEIWILKYPEIIYNHQLMRRRLFYFYLIYHTVLFCLILNITFPLTNEIFIIIASSTIWLPSIINNAIRVKIKNPPLLITILISINRIYHFIYYKGTNKSDCLLRVHSNYYVIFYIIIILIIQHLIMYLQIKYDGNFFLCQKLKEKCEIKTNIKYLSEKDLINLKGDSILNNECMICMHKLSEKNIILENGEENVIETEELNDKSINKSQNLTSQNIIHICSENKIKNNLGSFKANIFCIFLRILEILFNFHKYNSISKEDFILTTNCNHLFHSNCLNDWIKIKNQCPVDRRELILDD